MDMPNAIAALFGFVAIYDTQALLRGTATISSDYREALAKHPVLTLAGTAYIIAHLTNKPRGFEKIDLLHQYARLFGKRV